MIDAILRVYRYMDSNKVSRVIEGTIDWQDC
jgi:hypothetical protein